MERDYKIYVGTYANENEAGIFLYGLAGAQRKLKLKFKQPGISNPSYLALSSEGEFLYAVMENMEYHGEAGGGIFALKCSENSLELVNSRGTRGTLPCHVLLDEEHKVVYAANYMSGSLSMFPLAADGSLENMSDFRQHKGNGPNGLRQEGPHVHFSGLSPEKDGIWSVDLGIDRIIFYEADFQNMSLHHRPERDIVFPGGTGPRHFVFSPGNSHKMYVVCELTSEVFVVDLSGGESRMLQRISTLKEGDPQNTCAAIKCSEDGRFLYVSNRGDDSIAAYEIERETGLLRLVQIQKTGGRTPRDILVLEDMVLAANQDSNTITCFLRDEKTGLMTPEQEKIICHSPVCLIAIALDIS